MNLFEKLNISLHESELISIVGGGGKTTTMFRLANELVKYNKRVLITTTTAMMEPREDKYERLIILDEGYSFSQTSVNGITVLAKERLKGTKLKGVDKKLIDEIYKSKIYDYILVEADGAKMKPFKAPAPHEPVIPDFTTKTIGVIGMDCLGKRIYSENVHRPEIINKLTNSKLGDIITSDIIYGVIVADEGMFKNAPVKSQKYLILNKAESKEKVEGSIEIKDKLTKNKFYIDGIIIGSMRSECFDNGCNNGLGIF